MDSLTTLQRIKQYIDYKGISVSQFEKSIGMSNGSFASQLKNRKTIGVDKLENILNQYQDLNPIWLLKGKGNMLFEDLTIQNIQNTPTETINKGKDEDFNNGNQEVLINEFFENIKAHESKSWREHLIIEKTINESIPHLTGFHWLITNVDLYCSFLKRIIQTNELLEITSFMSNNTNLRERKNAVITLFKKFESLYEPFRKAENELSRITIELIREIESLDGDLSELKKAASEVKEDMSDLGLNNEINRH